MKSKSYTGDRWSAGCGLAAGGYPAGPGALAYIPFLE
jgi:hypothetical protein